MRHVWTWRLCVAAWQQLLMLTKRMLTVSAERGHAGLVEDPGGLFQESEIFTREREQIDKEINISFV